MARKSFSMSGAENLIDLKGRPSWGKTIGLYNCIAKSGLSIVLDRVSCIQRAEGTWRLKRLGSMVLAQKSCVEHRFGLGFMCKTSRVKHSGTKIVC